MTLEKSHSKSFSDFGKKIYKTKGFELFFNKTLGLVSPLRCPHGISEAGALAAGSERAGELSRAA